MRPLKEPMPSMSYRKRYTTYRRTWILGPSWKSWKRSPTKRSLRKNLKSSILKYRACSTILRLCADSSKPSTSGWLSAQPRRLQTILHSRQRSSSAPTVSAAVPQALPKGGHIQGRNLISVWMIVMITSRAPVITSSSESRILLLIDFFTISSESRILLLINFLITSSTFS